MNQHSETKVRHMRPSFIVPGGQKCGTSSIFAWLSIHPKILPPVKKEVDFFWQDSLFEKGLDWYLGHFPALQGAPAEEGCITFEATPNYLSTPGVAARIHAVYPDMKFVILLRDPVERALSQYQMYLRKVGNESALRISAAKYDEPIKSFFLSLIDPGKYDSFEGEIMKELETMNGSRQEFVPGFLEQGIYYPQVKAYLDYFPREQIKIIETGSLNLAPEEMLVEILEFLELPVYDWSFSDLQWHNMGNYSRGIPREFEKFLRDFFAPHNEKLFELLGRHFGW